MKPKIVTLCGSTKYCDIIAVCAWIIERDEKAITMGLHLLPHWYGDIPHHLAEFEGAAKDMDTLHQYKIDLSNEIFVVNYKDYIGESTSKEVRYALGQNKLVRWYTHDPIGDKVNEIIDRYTMRRDELLEAR